MNRDDISHGNRWSLGIVFMLLMIITPAFTFERKNVDNPPVAQIITDTPRAPIPTPTRKKKDDSNMESSSLRILTTNQIIQENGIVVSTAQLFIGPYEFGTLQLTSPSILTLGQTGIIRFLLTPDSVLTGLPQVNVPTISSTNDAGASAAKDTNNPSSFLQFNDRLMISSLMAAELKGIKFNIEPPSISERSIVSSMPAEWVWLIEPLAPGNQPLILSISIPIVVEQSFGTRSFQTLKNIPIEIAVEVTPTPVPTQTPIPTNTPTSTSTSTPLPLITRISERLIENVSTIFVAIIGLIGVLAGVYVTYINAKKAEVEKSRTNKIKKSRH